MTACALTVYTGAKNTNPIAREELTWDEFCNEVQLALFEERKSKGSMIAFAPYRLSPGKCRSVANVQEMSAVVGLDFDSVASVPDLLKSLRAFNLAAIVHTSPSDPAPSGARKVRVYILCEPHPKEQCGRVRRALAALLGETLDAQTCNADRIFFVGKLPNTPDREVWQTEGEPLQLAVLFATVGDMSTARAPKPPTSGAPSMVSIDDPDLRAKLDAVVDAVAPHFQTPYRHALALAVGGYICNRQLPIEAGHYVGRRLCFELGLSNDPKTRLRDFTDPWTMASPAGAAELRAIAPELLEQLDAIFIDRGVQGFATRLAARNAAANDPDRNCWHPPDFGQDSESPTERRTELGNAHRLVRMHGERLRCYLAFKTWFVWDGARWAEDSTGAIERLAKDTVESLWAEAIEEPEHLRKIAVAWAAKSQDRSRIANMIALAATEPGIPVTAADLDADPWLLNVRNGTLDLQSGKLTEPDPALLMTKCCATPYEPEARSDLWDAFVKRTTGNDAKLAAYIQRALGYALIGAWREKHFWFGYGPPDGAKSTLLGVVGEVLGDYHVSAAASTWMVQSNLGGNRGDITRLRGARLVTSLEIRPGLRFDEELVKKVTGGDAIVAAAKYKDEIEFAPTFALWMGANDRPTIRDDDAGMWSRMRCVPFVNTVPKSEQDPHLRATLTSDAHAPAVLRWLVDGCLEYQRNGIGECAAVTAATNDYRTSMNQAGGFVEECIEVTGNPQDEVPCKAMWAAYDHWALQNNVRHPLTAKGLGQRLRALDVQGGDDATKHVVQQVQRRIGAFVKGGADRHWRGVRLIVSE